MFSRKHHFFPEDQVGCNSILVSNLGCPVRCKGSAGWGRARLSAHDQEVAGGFSAHSFVVLRVKQKLICVSRVVNQEMGCLSVSFSQEGGATRNKQDVVGDLPFLGRMDPHFSHPGAEQRYPQSHHNGVQTGRSIDVIPRWEPNSARPLGWRVLSLGHGDGVHRLGWRPARDSLSPPCAENLGRKSGWCSSICSWDTTSFQACRG